jgi:COP9 signalosome complex subunit 2
VYEVTLRSLRDGNNDRLWFQTNLRLARLYLEAGRFAEVNRMLAELKQSCMRADGAVDSSRATALVEAYCLEIQLCTATHDHARMREVYPRTLHLNAAVSDPRIMGVIREEGGKMYLSEGAWMAAYNEFFEAFRAFQEAGSPRAKACLKYVVLASMLAVSDINPFAAREARIYAEDPEIVALGELRQSLEAADLARFERVLRDDRGPRSHRLREEPLLMQYLEPLRRKMREQVSVMHDVFPRAFFLMWCPCCS